LFRKCGMLAFQSNGPLMQRLLVFAMSCSTGERYSPLRPSREGIVVALHTSRIGIVAEQTRTSPGCGNSRPCPPGNKSTAGPIRDCRYAPTSANRDHGFEAIYRILHTQQLATRFLAGQMPKLPYHPHIFSSLINPFWTEKSTSPTAS